MNSNHLIIGLGGTGGKIIRSLRKTIFIEHQNVDPSDLHIGYLYIDSSNEMMELSDPTWKIFGTSVQVGTSNQVHIKKGDLKTILENVHRYPGITKWIGAKKIWDKILDSMVGEAAGGQKRRLGRFLLAANMNNVMNGLQSQVRKLRNNSGQTDITFHVCCGLAGGTGSGSVVDIVSQIRKEYPPSASYNYRIIIYALLPEEHPRPNWDTGNYHSNGYAALMELNDLSLGNYQPFDITGEKSERLQLREPFNGCYVFSINNEKGVTVDVEDMPDIVANFLYQKVVAVKDISWTSLRRQENAENGDSTAEMSPEGGKAERSVRFLTFGIKRLAIPNEEIKEYITYSFAKQASLQLKYNNWSDELGYKDEKKNRNFHEYVRQPDNLERWLISDEHLCLSKAIINDGTSQRWKSINDEWKNVIPIFKNMAKEGDKTDEQFDKLVLLCVKRYEEDYRNLGVKKFYETKRNDIKDHAREIRERIEGDLFDEWKNGDSSIHDLTRVIDSLLQFMGERKEKIEIHVTRHQKSIEGIEAKKRENEVTWAKIGILSAFWGKRNKVLDALAINLQDLYINKTHLEGWYFAKRLLQELDSQLNSLRKSIITSDKRLRGSIRYFEDNIARRVKEDYAYGHIPSKAFQERIVKFYDPTQVKDTVADLVIDKKIQTSQTADLRQTLVKEIGENPSFSKFNNRLSESRLKDLIESNCERNATLHASALEEQDDQQLLEVNVIARLKEKYEGNFEELRLFVKNLVDYSGNYININSVEANKTGSGTKGSSQHTRTFTVILPTASEHEDFVKELKRAFKEVKPNDVAGDIEFIETSARPYEITLINITNLFPLRYASLVEKLKNKYDLRTNGDEKERRRMEIHTEGNGTQYSNLFVPTKEEEEEALRELQNETLKYLLIARATNLLTEAVHPETGITQWEFAITNEHGLDETPLNLGKSFIATYRKVDKNNQSTIINEVEKTIKKKFKHIDDRKRLIKTIVDLIVEIKSELNNNRYHPEYILYNDAAKETIKILEYK